MVKLIVFVLLAMGVAFRFANLDLKVYGHDESHTLVRVAGFTRGEVKQRLVNGREIGIEDLQKFQRPNLERDWTYTVKALAADDRQHTPIYFMMARLWAEWFGSSPAATRSLPALLSLLMLPCMYWLCRELFSSSLVGWIAMAIVAISPLHVLYAQEARPYSLLGLAALLSSAVLLRAMRVQTRWAWLGYAVTVAFSLYSQLLFGLVLLGHGVYVAAMERFRMSHLTIAYILSAIAGIITFTPWLIIVAANFSAVESLMSWTAKALPFASMVKAWAGDFGRSFIDSGFMGPDFSSNRHLGFFALLIALNLVVAGMVLYSLWFLWRNASNRVWLFVFILIGSASLPLIVADLVLGWHLSTAGRYLLPAYLGIQLAVSYLLAATMLVTSSVWHRRIWQQAGMLLALGGVISCLFMSQAAVWWNRSHVYHNPSIARIINRSSQALLINEGTAMEDLFSLSYLLKTGTRLQLVGNTAPEIADTDRDIFLFRPSEALRKKLEKSYSLELVHPRGGLWQLK
jgi:uncharacterized membrane protein